MKQTTAYTSMVATGIILGCVIVGLAFIPHGSHASPNIALENGLCAIDGCARVPSLVVTSDLPNQPLPTTAPAKPKAGSPIETAYQEEAAVQQVYLKVETDYNEIEVGWASP